MKRLPESMTSMARFLKLCTFKVSEDYEGYRYGELLLKAVFEYSDANQFDWIFTTVLPEKEFFLNYLVEFGFEVRDQIKDDREHILAKRRFFTPEEMDELDACPSMCGSGHPPSSGEVRRVSSCR